MGNAYRSVLAIKPTGDAVPANVLSGKTFSNADGAGKTGTMANNGAVSITLTDQNPTYTIPEGYHNGLGVVGFTSSGGDGADLVVTCASAYSGLTISCSDGSTTYQKTCPTSSPYQVTFESIPTGTWTVSGTIGGQTFSTTILISDFEAILGTIPEGSTVLPTDDIQTWLYCAGIFDKNYTTISQVLDDASTLQALITSSNAADYMARSTTWAADVTADSTAMSYIGLNNYCSNTLLSNVTWLSAIGDSTYFENVLNVKVPIMTSNTTPSGVASCSTTWGAQYFDAYKAFAGGTEDIGWISAPSASFPQYLYYEFPDNIKAVKIKFEKYNSGNGNMNGVFQESSDGNSYSDLIAFTTSSPTKDGLVVSNYPLTAKKYYRFRCNSYNYNGNASSIGKAQIYGRVDV